MSRIRFLIYKNIAFLIVVALVILIAIGLFKGLYLYSIIIFLSLFACLSYAGQKVAPIYLGKRVLVFLKTNGGCVDSELLHQALNFERNSITIGWLREKSFITTEENKVRITEDGINQLKVWGG